MEDCVGHLVNLVPIRFDFSSKPSFRELCRTTNTVVLDARENAWVGLAKIVKDLKIARDPARVPLVPVTFTHVQKYAPGKIGFGFVRRGLRAESSNLRDLEVNLNAIESHEGLLFQAMPIPTCTVTMADVALAGAGDAASCGVRVGGYVRRSLTAVVGIRSGAGP